LDNLDAILENSHRITQAIEGLEDAPLSDELRVLQESEDQLEGLRDKFFMKTIAAVPATKACLTGAERVLQAMESFKDDQGEESLMTLKQGLKDLSENVGELLEQAQMSGTTLT
jgi:hypothetical protein